MKFNVEKALRDTRAKLKERYLAEGRQEKPDCMRCPLYKADQIRLTGIYDDLSPTTDGKIQAERMDNPPIVPQPRGRYFGARHKEFMRTQHAMPKVRFTTVKLDPMPPT